MKRKLANFAARLCGFISNQQSEINDRQFSELALELFALQFKSNTAYQRICRRCGMMPQAMRYWAQIPAVPTTAFKELELTCIPPCDRIAVFHSTGTTEQRPSRHFHSADSLAVYEASLWPWFEQHFFADLESGIRNSELLILSPPPEKVPHSSLVHMFETIRRKLGAPQSAFVGKITAAGTWTLDLDAVLAALNDNLEFKTKNSKLLLGTAFSFVHLLDFLSLQNLLFRLPSGSRVMETGGYKNRSRSLPRADLHKLIAEKLGIPLSHIVSEYGMSELSSQAYDAEISVQNSKPKIRNLERNFRFPSWVRVQIVSPETGCEVADGETGLVRVFDLANVFSVMAVQTEDLGIRRGDGFELIGRAQFAEPRGCSLITA